MYFIPTTPIDTTRAEAFQYKTTFFLIKSFDFTFESSKETALLKPLMSAPAILTLAFRVRPAIFVELCINVISFCQHKHSG